MKKFLILLSLLATTFLFFHVPVIAQDKIDESVQEESEINQTGVSVSPPTILIDQADIGKKFIITVTNLNSEPITLIATEKYVQRNDDKQTEIVDNDNTKAMLDFSEEPFTINTGEEYKFVARVKLSLNATEGIYPAISFSESRDDGNIDLGSEILSVFLVQNLDGEPSIDANVEISSSSNLVTSPKLNINGEILNDGSKYYNPSGTVKILKGETVLFEKQITTQIEGLLFPQETVDYSIEWENTETLIDAVGTYTIEIAATPSPFSTTKITRIMFFYLPIQIIYITIVVIALLVVVVAGITQVKKKKKSKK